VQQRKSSYHEVVVALTLFVITGVFVTIIALVASITFYYNRARSAQLCSLLFPSSTQSSEQELPYSPDNMFVDKDNVVLLFSKQHQSIFRWDPVLQAYLSGLSLVGVATFAAYAREPHTIYTAYASGLIRKIDLSEENNKIVEEPLCDTSNGPSWACHCWSLSFCCRLVGCMGFSLHFLTQRNKGWWSWLEL